MPVGSRVAAARDRRPRRGPPGCATPGAAHRLPPRGPTADPAESPCWTAARAGVTVSDRLEPRGDGAAEAHCEASDPGRAGRAPGQADHTEVRAEGRQTEEQQRTVVAGDGSTLVRAKHGSSREDVALRVVGDRTGGVPAVGQRREDAGPGQRDDVPPPEAGAAEVGDAGQTVRVGGVHPVVHGAQPGRTSGGRCAVRPAPPVDNRGAATGLGSSAKRLGSRHPGSRAARLAAEPSRGGTGSRRRLRRGRRRGRGGCAGRGRPRRGRARCRSWRSAR